MAQAFPRSFSQREKHRDAFGQLPRRHQGGFANSDHWEARDGPGCIEPGIIEARDNSGIGIGRLQQRLNQSWNRKGYVIKTFDRGRSHPRGHQNFGGVEVAA